MAIVGESGSGKSSLALAVGRLLPPGGDIAAGAVRVDGVDVARLEGADLRQARGRLVGYLAQDSMAALNPVLPAGLQVAEVFEAATAPDAARPAARRSSSSARWASSGRRTSRRCTRTSSPAACASG